MQPLIAYQKVEAEAGEKCLNPSFDGQNGAVLHLWFLIASRFEAVNQF